MRKPLACLLISFFLLLSLPLHAETHVIRFATVTPSGSPWSEEIIKNGKEMEAQSGGRLVLKLYDSAKMGDEPDFIRKMRSGQLQAAAFTGYGLSQVEKSILVLELPFLFESDGERDFVFTKMLPFFQKRFLERGFVLLDFSTYGQVYFMSTKPVNNLADLQKLKMWVWEGDPLIERFFHALKINTVGTPLTEVLVGLQTGMVEGVYCPPLASVGFQWWTRANHIVSPPFRTGVSGVLASNAQWAKLSPADQKTVSDSLSKTVKTLSVLVTKDNAAALKSLEQNKIKLTTFEPAALAELRQVSAKFRSDIVGQVYDREALAEVDRLIGLYRQQVAGK